MHNFRNLLRFAITGMAATTTAIVITGLTPETTEATLICHRLVCQKASNEGSAFGTKYQRKCTCENVSESATVADRALRLNATLACSNDLRQLAPIASTRDRHADPRRSSATAYRPRAGG